MAENLGGLDWMKKLDDASAPVAVSTLQSEMLAAQGDITSLQSALDGYQELTSALSGDKHTVSAGEDTAGLADIDMGADTARFLACSVWRANKNVTGDAVITETNGVLRVADGSTFALTTGDVVRWIAAFANE